MPEANCCEENHDGGGSGFPHFWQNAATLVLPMPQD